MTEFRPIATPPLLKSVDSARLDGPPGIPTRRDLHLCYSMDSMARSVDTTTPTPCGPGIGTPHPPVRRCSLSVTPSAQIRSLVRG